MRSRRLLPLALAVVILAASLVPGGGGGATGGTVGAIGVDKLLHFGGYALLTAVSLAALRARSARTVLAVALLVTVFGGVVELLQGPVPGRSVSTLDLVADALGALVGGAAWWLVGRDRLDEGGEKRLGR